MKRNTLIAIALLSLVLLSVSCASAPAAPAVKGTLASVENDAISVTPAEGGQATSVKIGWGTRVYWQSGLEASGTSVLTAGQAVQVWTSGDTATKIVIAQ